MKLLVLGATGGIGLETVRQAVARHHSVTALVRSPDRLGAFRDCIALEQGDLLSSSELERAMQGKDAILSAFGPRVPVAKADANLLRDFASALTFAMQQKIYIPDICVHVQWLELQERDNLISLFQVERDFT